MIDNAPIMLTIYEPEVTPAITKCDSIQVRLDAIQAITFGWFKAEECPHNMHDHMICGKAQLILQGGVVITGWLPCSTALDYFKSEAHKDNDMEDALRSVFCGENPHDYTLGQILRIMGYKSETEEERAAHLLNHVLTLPMSLDGVPGCCNTFGKDGIQYYELPEAHVNDGYDGPSWITEDAALYLAEYENDDEEDEEGEELDEEGEE